MGKIAPLALVASFVRGHGPSGTVGAIVTAPDGPLKRVETTSRPAFPTVPRP